jgi:TonB-linked SusC/RagA family outer membrane protein
MGFKQRLPILSVFIVFLMLGATSHLYGQNNQTVSGTVTDAQTGNPLIGVNILVMGTSTGTATDNEGHYSLNVPSLQDTLRFSFIGYKTKNVPINEQMTINITLKPTIISGQQMVVVGFGTTKKKNLTASVATVGTKELENRTANNTAALLEGTMPGVQVTQTSGRPGHPNTSILIRGLGTMNNSSPLVLIDGLEGSLNNVNPNDIANISVLKDAAAAAIYGARAANGVILVTTKKGKPNTSTISYHMYVGRQKLTRRPQRVGSAEFAMLFNESNENEGLAPQYTKDEIEKFKSGSDPYNYPNTNWMDLVTQGSGFTQNHSLIFSGGSDKTQYNLSLGYNKVDGLVERTNDSKYNLRLNLKTKLNEWLTTGTNIGLTREKVTNPTVAPGHGWSFSQIFRQARRMRPTIVNKYKDGSWGRYTDGNPVAWMKDGGLNNVYHSHLLGSLFGKINFMNNLSLKGTVGVDYGIVNQHKHIKKIDYHNGSSQGPNSLTNDVKRNQIITLRAVLNYEKTYNNNNFKVLLGISRKDNWNRAVGAFRKNFPNNELAQINAGSSVGWSNSGSSLNEKLASYFGRFDYNYKEKYLFQFNLRRDGSSKFKKGNRWGIFPSFAASWKLSSENFLNNVKWLDLLKLRATWGELGNNRISNYQYFSLLSLGVNYPFGGAIENGSAVTIASNPAITWETSKEWDIGIDATFLSSFSVTADYYHRYTFNILTKVPTSETFGLPAPLVNAGAMRNTGVELDVKYSNNIGKLHYNISGNGSYNKNVVVEFKNPSIGTTIKKEGIAWNSYYGYQVIGKFQTDQEATNSPHPSGAPVKAGDLQFKDQNNDGKINGEDRVVLGNPIPQITYGFNLNLAYKNISLTAFFQGATKVQKAITSEVEWPISHFSGAYKRQLDRTIVKNGKVVKQGTYPRTLNNETQNKVFSSFEVYNSSYLRLKNIRLIYTLPNKIISNIGISKLSIYFSGENMLTFSPMPKVVDPEYGGNTNNYPLVKTYTLGLDLKF